MDAVTLGGRDICLLHWTAPDGSRGAVMDWGDETRDLSHEEYTEWLNAIFASSDYKDYIVYTAAWLEVDADADAGTEPNEWRIYEFTPASWQGQKTVRRQALEAFGGLGARQNA